MVVIFSPDLFQGQTVLVTGGGSGMGLRMARDFLKYGARRVVLLGRDAAKLEAARGN